MKKIYIIGIGMGNPDTITIEGRKRIEESDVLIGARRMVESVIETLAAEVTNVPSAAKKMQGICSRANSSDSGKTQKQRTYYEIAADRIAQILQREEFSQASVLMSGDVGFYSGAKKLLPLLSGQDVSCIAGVSSVQYFCARLGTSWEDVRLVSLHGREGDPVAAVQENARVFFLTGSDHKAEDICRQLTQAGLGRTKISAGQRLSYGDETIVCATAQELAGRHFDPLTVLLAEWEEAALSETGQCGGKVQQSKSSGPGEENLLQRATFGYEDELFIRGDVPMTKSEIRSIVLSKLRLRRTDTAYDIGAGTGSVSVEMAMAASQGQVYAIEVNPEGAELIRSNARKFGAANLHVVEGAAPGALALLPAPDAAFLGGTKGHMDEIIAVLTEKNSKVRIVINAIALETAAEALQCLKAHGFSSVEAITVTVAKSRKAGRYHMMMGQNPIYIITGCR